MSERAISEFQGQYRFLSNFWPAPVILDGVLYPSVEHAYQAAKFPPEKRARFADIRLKAGTAKKLGRGIQPPSWKKKNLILMLGLLRQKFSDPQLKELLLKTGDAELIEGNYWGDTFFGVCRGAGENRLGKLLMEVREEIRK